MCDISSSFHSFNKSFLTINIIWNDEKNISNHWFLSPPEGHMIATRVSQRQSYKTFFLLHWCRCDECSSICPRQFLAAILIIFKQDQVPAQRFEHCTMLQSIRPALVANIRLNCKRKFQVEPQFVKFWARLTQRSYAQILFLVSITMLQWLDGARTLPKYLILGFRRT